MSTTAPQPEPTQDNADGPAHDHGPTPSFEWILEGDREIIVPHLRTIAPSLIWENEHFHVCDPARAGEGLPEMFQVQLADEPVGALDFMPLPSNRTLMRLYLCSDLGAACSLKGGDQVMQGFATAWLARLNALGFLANKPREVHSRPLGFPTPPVLDAAEVTRARKD